MARALPALLGLALAGCFHSGGAFVWVDAYVAPKPLKEYVIVSGDVLNVRVFQQENMSFVP